MVPLASLVAGVRFEPATFRSQARNAIAAAIHLHKTMYCSADGKQTCYNCARPKFLIESDIHSLLEDAGFSRYSHGKSRISLGIEQKIWILPDEPRYGTGSLLLTNRIVQESDMLKRGD